MSDLIKREDAIKELSKVFANCEPCDKEEASDIAVTTIKELPSADRPQGKWITYYPPMSDMQKHMCGVKEKGYVPDKRFGRSKCNLCGCGRPMYEDNYCPRCGARMKGADYE